VSDRPASFGAALWEWVARDGDACSFIDPWNRSYSRAEFALRTSGAAELLRKAGVVEGDRVLALAENHIGLVVGIFACWHEGAIIAPFDPAHRGPGFLETVARVAPRALIVDDVGLAALEELPDRSLPLLHVEQLAEASPATDRAPKWNDPAALSSLIFSSGTTGTPKACALSHEYWLWVAEEITGMTGFTRDDRMLTLGPFHHSSAWSYFGPSILAGTPHAFDRRFSASRFWGRVRQVEATMFDYIGAILAILLRTPGEAVPSLRLAVGSGARTEDWEAWEARFGVPLVECYGLTECLIPVKQTLDARRPGSMGRLTRFFDARLVDPELRDVPPGTPGELLLRPKESRTIFDGYWGDPDATEAAFVDGWFRTRDLIRVDEDGWYWFVDRLGQVIRRRGENLSAWELEGTLLQHPAIHLCAAIGVPSDLGEEDILVAAELEPDATLDPDDFRAWAVDSLPRHMIPRYLRCVDALPRTASERIARHALRADGVTDDTVDLEGARVPQGGS
jgi:crotonobetaine/carnitine-CoA ligase